jgi:hypothetical protein
LERGEAIHAALTLPGGGWNATVEPDPDGETRLVGAGAGSVALYLSAADVARLADPSAEGVYFHGPPDGNAEGLRYYIEKDFPCLHPRAVEAEEQSETFVPPLDFAERERRRIESC